MRIAMVGIRGIPARVGGAEHVAEELTCELTARGHEVLAYSRPEYVAGAGAPRAGRSIVTACHPTKHLEAITHTATALWDVLRRRVDLIHLHSPGPALLSWLPVLARRPLVLTIHAPDWARAKWSAPARAVLRTGLAVGMRLADQVTAVAHWLAEDLAKKWGREVTCVPNAVRAAPAAVPALRTSWGLQPDRYALYVGRIVPEKRLHTLIEAWGLRTDSLPLVVAGEITPTGYVLRCLHAARAAGRRVRFVGPQYGQALAALYAHAGVVVHPSELEGMSLVLLEAASHGRCVLAGDIPANREVLGEAALYYKCGDADELHARMCRCIQDGSLRRRLGREARSRVARRYSWSRSTDLLETVYRRALGAHRHRP